MKISEDRKEGEMVVWEMIEMTYNMGFLTWEEWEQQDTFEGVRRIMNKYTMGKLGYA